MDSKLTLYQLTKEYQELASKLLESADDDGCVDSLIANELQVTEQRFTEKAISCGSIIKMYKDEVEKYEKAIKQLQAEKKKIERVIARIEDNLTSCCQELSIDKIDGFATKISFRPSERVVVENESILDSKYVTEVKTQKVDKDKIKQDIKKGVEVNGAYIQQFVNIQVR